MSRQMLTDRKIRPRFGVVPAILSLSIFVTLPTLSAWAESPLAGLDEYVEQAMAAWEVPGIGMSIVKDDQVVMARGFGVRKLGEDTPVDEKTLFAIGSCSKAFTAAAVGVLKDRGKLDWDNRVQKYLPEFELYDPYVTRELVIRDLLCHRVGLARGDRLWYGTAYSRAEILHRIRYLEPEWSFRSRFGYQNIMYLAAGEIIPRVTEQGWDDFVKQSLFLPLGMKTTNTSVVDVLAAPNAATPHEEIDEVVEPIPWRNIDNIAPAGSINSNAVEMANWVRLHLGEGEFEGQRVLSTEVVAEMQTPQTIQRLEGPMKQIHPDSHFLAYGFGWSLYDYHGRKIVEHGGAIDGMRALVAMMPEGKLGMVVLTNRGGSLLPAALMYRVFDAYLGNPEHDWSTEMLEFVTARRAEAREAKEKREAERAKDTKPSVPLLQYVGTYREQMYGDVAVSLEEGKLVFAFGPAFVGELSHWHYDTFEASFRDRSIGKQLITFRLNESGEVSAVDVPGMAEFKRVAEEPAEKK